MLLKEGAVAIVETERRVGLVNRVEKLILVQTSWEAWLEVSAIVKSSVMS